MFALREYKVRKVGTSNGRRDIPLSGFREQLGGCACRIIRPPPRSTKLIGENLVTTQQEVATHKFEAVHFVMLLELEVLVYVPLIHPFGDHAELMFT